MVKIIETGFQFEVTLNGLRYTICDSMEEARREANMLRKELRVGR